MRHGTDQLLHFVLLHPAHFSLDHLQEGEAFEFAEGAGGGDGEDGFGDHGFDHEPGDDLEFGDGDNFDFVVAADESFEAGFVDVVGPGGGIVGAAEDGELECAVGDVNDARLEAGGVVVDDGDNFAVAEEHVAGVPVAVDDLRGPLGETGRLRLCRRLGEVGVPRRKRVVASTWSSGALGKRSGSSKVSGS